jgi:transcriptional regulator with XRE-family HTH domain
VQADPSDWLTALGDALRERRREHGISQERLGLEVARPGREAVHRNYVGGIERGQRNPTVEIVIELVNQLDGDVAGLFARAGELVAEQQGPQPGESS